MPKVWKLFTTAAVIFYCLAGAVVAQSPGNPLWQGFENPPSSARPRVWWHWMNGNITKEGIKLDLGMDASRWNRGLPKF